MSNELSTTILKISHLLTFLPMKTPKKQEKKKCLICGTFKLLSDFSKQGKYYKSYCKPCVVKKAVEWAKKNPEKNREKALKYLHKF